MLPVWVRAGTITGVGEYLKSRNPAVKVAAVEPAASPVLSQGVALEPTRSRLRRRLCADNLNTEIYDEVLAVSNEEPLNRQTCGTAGGECWWASRPAPLSGLL